MSAEFSYDPVTAADEATATGETARIFADIRATMGIPLITSIWRGLADMDDALHTVWNATKPIFLSGQVDKALARVIERCDLPAPAPLTASQLASAGISGSQLEAIRTIIDAYNRSNGMNMVALAALVSPESGEREDACPHTTPEWGEFPALLPRDAIDDNTWELVRKVNAFGAPGIDAHVATLWRHLAHWPSLFPLIDAALAPRHTDGSITAAATRMVELTRREGAALAPWRSKEIVLADPVRKTITDYVNEPTLVARMVTIGHTLANWLPRQ